MFPRFFNPIAATEVSRDFRHGILFTAESWLTADGSTDMDMACWMKWSGGGVPPCATLGQSKMALPQRRFISCTCMPRTRAQWKCQWSLYRSRLRPAHGLDEIRRIRVVADYNATSFSYWPWSTSIWSKFLAKFLNCCSDDKFDMHAPFCYYVSLLWRRSLCNSAMRDRLEIKEDMNTALGSKQYVVFVWICVCVWVWLLWMLSSSDVPMVC